MSEVNDHDYSESSANSIRITYDQLTELVEPKRISDGFLLTVSPQNKVVNIFVFCFGLIWTAFSGGLFFIVLQGLISINTNSFTFDVPSLFFIAVVSLFLMMGLIMLGPALLEFWTDIKLHPAELVLSKYPLRLGETCPIYYRRKLRNGTFSTSKGIEAWLVCDEWVKYTQGTDTTTKTLNLYIEQLPHYTITSGESQADYDTDIFIPIEQPPSFYADNNKIRWRLIVELRVPGIPKVCESVFHLKVLPEVLSQ